MFSYLEWRKIDSSVALHVIIMGMKILGIPSLRRIIVITGIASLLISYAGIWINLINDRAERTGADFIHFYSAGRIAQARGASQVYNLELQQDIEEEQVGFTLAPGQVLPFNHLPFIIPLLQTVMTENYVLSFHRWNLIMIVLYGLAIGICSWILHQSGIDRKSIGLSAIGGFLFLPLFFSIMNGQDNALVFLGTAIWVYGLFSKKFLLAGIGLGLTTVRPHIALVLALPMLFHNRKVFLGFLFSAGALALVSVAVIGLNGVQDFIRVLFVTAGGKWYGINQDAMVNLIGLLMRSLPVEADIIRIVGWAVYGLVIVGVCILWSRKEDLLDGRIGLTVILAIFSVPHMHYPDLTLLLIPIYLLIRSSAQGGMLKQGSAAILSIAVSLSLLVSNATPILQYNMHYLIMAGLAGYPYLKQMDRHRKTASSMIAMNMNTR